MAAAVRGAMRPEGREEDWPQASRAPEMPRGGSARWTWVSAPGCVSFPCREARPLLWTRASEQPGSSGPSIGTPVLVVWKRGHVFPRGGVLSHEGVCFPMCRVRCFFLPPWTHVGPLKRISAGICTPESHSLLPSPPHPTSLPNGDPGSGVFPDSDPWEGTEEIKSFPPQLPLCAPPTHPSEACLSPVADVR